MATALYLKYCGLNYFEFHYIMETIRPYLEALYFITGGPLLAVFAFLALKQITVAKQNSRTQSLRDAYRLAAEQVRFYAEQIVPNLNEIDKLLVEKKIHYVDTAVIEVKFDSISVAGAPSDEDIDKMIEIAPIVVTTLNRLETFAIFFVSKVAAENVAYSSIGKTYVSSVKALLPLFITSAKNKSYESITRLFILWHSRLEAERLEQESNNLRAQLRSLKTKNTVPIGAEDQ